MIYKRVCVRKLCGVFNLRPARIKISVFYVFKDCSGKKMRILQNHSKRPPQVIFCNLVQRNSIVKDFSVSVRNIVKTRKKICNSRLPGTGRAYKRDFLPRLGMNRNIMQDSLF